MNKENSKIKILLVDDHPLVMDGIRSCLETHDQLAVVGEVLV